MSRHRGIRTRLVVVSLLAAALVAAVWGAAALYDGAHRDRLAPGIRVGGVAVGGLSSAAAEQRLRQIAVAPRRRDLRVHGAGHTWVLSASQLRVGADVHAAVARALADSHRGWLGARVADGLTGRRVDENLHLATHYATAVVPALVAKVAAQTDRAPVDAKVRPGAGGLTESASQDGVGVDKAGLRRQIAAAVRDASRPADIAVPTHPVQPHVGTTDLATRYPAYIIIDRKAHELRFYQHLKLAHTYAIAVGRAGLETPSGLYDIQWKQVNPSWYVPNSAWAGKLAGKTIPPGPQDPIKARWMAFDGSAGIHGIDPSEYSSIGHDASHGCVRMRIPDVIALYSQSPVGTPVYIA